MSRPIALLAGLAFLAPAGLAGQQPVMNFFATSVGSGNGADLGGLDGADRHCRDLAKAAGSPLTLWRAYLSATAKDGTPAVHARDRIGTGPWYNHAGVLIAKDVDDLHREHANLTKATILTEKGDTVNGRGDQPNMHDFLTGSQVDGTAFSGEGDTTCNNWTSHDSGSARVGHHDRQGGGEHPTSWNSAHPSRGCSQQNLQSSGGNGLFFCFGIS